MRLTPVIALLGDHTMSRVQWTLHLETERLDALRAEHTEIDSLLTENGWSTEMLAWGHIINGLMDLATFDDENGRTEGVA